jgi:hypothetical protein
MRTAGVLAVDADRGQRMMVTVPADAAGREPQWS